MINKKPLINFLLWIFCMILIIVLGISNVFADTYDATKYNAQLYDNYGPSLSSVSTYFSNNSWRGTIPTMTANSSGAAWGVSSPIVLLSNHTYSLSARIEGTYGGRITLSTYNRIGVGTSLSNAVSSYTNNSYVNENYSRVLDDGMTIQFAFTPTTNGSFIVFPFSTNVSGSNFSFYLYDIIINDLGGGGVSQTDITNSLNNQTNNINSNSNNNRDIINSNSNNNRDMIIQNQNENNDKLIESNQELLGNCIKNFMTSSSIVNTYNLWEDGNNFQQQQADTASSLALVVHAYNNGSFVSVLNSTTITSTGIYKLSFTKTSSFNQILFKLNGVTIDTGMLINVSNLQNNTTYYISANFFNITQGNIRFNNVMISDTNTTTFVPWGDTKCSSKLDDTNNAINDLNDTINDDDVDSSSWANFFNNFTTNTFGLTSIITAPLNLIQSLSSSTCTNLQIPLPYLSNKYLTLPCMSSIYSQYFGNFFTLYQTITFGIIAYWVCVRIFNLVKDFKNPEHDEIEVVDL